VVLWWDFALIFGIVILFLCCIFWVNSYSSYVVLDVFPVWFVDLSWYEVCFCSIRGSEDDG
jgi:hypothetical protein